MENITLALDKAKIALMSKEDSSFFTTVCFNLMLEWDKVIPTAATDGVSIFINPDYFMGLPSEMRVSLMLHETMHVAYQHMFRAVGFDHERFNIAADHVINLMLKERGFKIHSSWYADPQYSGMSVEQVYALLPNNPPNSTSMDILPAKGDPAELQKNIEDILVRASIQSRLDGDKTGSIPGEIQIFLDSLLSPKLPWQRILQKYLHTLSRDDYSFRKPNRRYFPEYHLPSLHSESLMDLVIAVDASGSVSDNDFKVFISETSSIFKMMKPKKITLLTFDTTIRSEEQLLNISELSKVVFKGRGGTRIKPVVDWGIKNKPQLLLVFTDGDFNDNPYSCKTNTLWLIHNNKSFKSNYGKVIHYHI